LMLTTCDALLVLCCMSRHLHGGLQHFIQ
jgi:hypothetical protein